MMSKCRRGQINVCSAWKITVQKRSPMTSSPVFRL